MDDYSARPIHNADSLEVLSIRILHPRSVQVSNGTKKHVAPLPCFFPPNICETVHISNKNDSPTSGSISRAQMSIVEKIKDKKEPIFWDKVKADPDSKYVHEVLAHGMCQHKIQHWLR